MRPPPGCALASVVLILAVGLFEALANPATPVSDSDDTGRNKRSSALGSRHFYFAKGRVSTGSASIKSSKPQAPAFQGGCPSRPMNPPHTTIQCHTFSGCRLNCLRDYIFPNGETRMIVTCESGEWQVEGTDWKSIPDCLPICRPPCQNNGICIKPNNCNCPESYTGPQCQYNRRPCLNDSPLPANSEKICTSKACTITCVKGHKFPDGSSITNLVCRDGSWVPSRKEWSSVPDCKPTCYPPCINGGNCLSYNTCQCPQDFKGPQCQYGKEACDPQKLNFNGQYSCKGDMNSLTCHLQCLGGHFDSAPAEAYKCQYATGTYLPSPIPKCIYDTMVQMVPRMPSPGSHFITVDSKSTSHSSYMSSLNLTSLFNKIPLDMSSLFHATTTTSVKVPTSGTCYVWGDHYKTFDGSLISFQNDCSYTLVQEAVDKTFSINLAPKHNGSRAIRIFTQDKEYNLLRNDKGIPIIKVGARSFHIPTQLPGVSVKYTAHFVELTVTLAGFSLMWDMENTVSVTVNEHLWNRTVGLCGRIDGYRENDFQTKDGKIALRIVPFVSSWQVEHLGETCSSVAVETNPCDIVSSESDVARRASVFCDKLLSDAHFAVCRSIVDVQQYYETCRWDFCSSEKSSTFSNSSQESACKSMAMYVKECSDHGISLPNWRDITMCSMECGGGQVYMACNPENQPTCGSEEEPARSSIIASEVKKSVNCIEGCYCPQGTVLHQNQCIKRSQCPCQLRGRSFPPGHTVPKDCNTCTCDNGRWTCTETRCSARCSCIGDPHYSTFDGKKFDFMGICSYYLLKSENYSVEAENVACSGALSKNMDFVNQQTRNRPSCSKSVTVRYGGKTIELKQSREVLVDGVHLPQVPADISGIYIHQASSIFTLVELPNNLTVWWDGVSSVYIDAPPSFHGKTRGLCGTFTMNQKDDFVTPEEDIEQSVIAFANKWKANEKCPDEVEEELSLPCDANPHKKESANKYCSRIKGPLFERCHWIVDPEPYFHNCMYDMCSCEQKVGQCFCPIVAAYAKECMRKGVHIDWRGSIRECGIVCPSGQQYQLCGNKCTRSCQSISLAPSCERECVEGCNCPEGQTLSDETGECIPISQCPCLYNNLEFQPAQKEIRPSTKGAELCTCSNARWDCRAATSEEIKIYPDAGSINYNCSAMNNEEYVACVHLSPPTCKNMHNTQLTTPTICRGGCVCKKGFVLDLDTKRCILPTQCPCHHGGRSYSEGGTIQEDCNTCVCEAGKWKCSEHTCSGVCSAWGDSHFRSFDSRIFDFHGTCYYLLAKGVISDEESFDVSIQNVECGSSGISCSKSVTLKVGAGSRQEIITFTKDKPIPAISGFTRIQVRIAGLFVFAEVTDLGLVLQWDQNTRVYVKIVPKWKSKVKGLCGNYNDDMLDDFLTPSGGLAEVSANLFGDSWRLQPYCLESVEIMDACLHHPNRKLWAMQKCGVLKSSLFQPCHSEVPVEPYLERCIFDSCACDLGGDCECLCTALAAYAHECNAQGVPIRWRSQNLCPMQCDEKCSNYSPCISTCPQTTCDNQYIVQRLTHLCKEDTCVEGCELKQCPPGEVYYNKTDLECVPIASCKTVCLEVGDVTYYEGDLMEQDDCHSCYCSRHQKMCRGTPCVPSPPPLPPPRDNTVLCKDGWTDWINSFHKDERKNETVEKEPMPSETYLINLKNDSPRCNLSQVEFVECRTVKTQINHKESGFNVSCNVEEGLVCYGEQCPDFEIRLLCKCGPSTTSLPVLTTQGPKCDAENPNKPHERNCFMFYQCVDTLNGPKFVEKSCGPNMMYNRENQVCDHSSFVIRKWPQCLGSTEPPLEISTESTERTTFHNLVKIFASSTTTEKIIVAETPEACKAGDVWKSCGVACDRVCLYYEFMLVSKGFCKNSDDCIQGCFSEEISGGCPPGLVWRDQNTCVSIADCTCYSHSGRPVKPGEVVHESECKICQCVNNQYVCDSTGCVTTEMIVNITESTVAPPEVFNQETETMTIPTTILIPSTSTPPLPCNEDRFIPLVQGISPLPDTAFSASSSDSGVAHQPYFARLEKNIKNDYSWISGERNGDQYLQVNIGRIEPIFGVSVQGGPSGFVTSYKLLYSADGNFYHYAVNENGKPMVFRGPVDSMKPLQQTFPVPVEAQYIRFNPLTWKNDISMRIEIYGCGEPLETLATELTTKFSTTFTTMLTTPSTECVDEMGLNNGLMSDGQIFVSSFKDENFGPSQLRLNPSSGRKEFESRAWMPATNDKDQWIQFDFVEPRNLTGFVTRGSEAANSWVEAFQVLYSQDGDTWNEFLDENKKEKVFPGNYDALSNHKNQFGRMLRSRFLRIVPIQWHNNIAVRAEAIGCFEPYPLVTTVTPPLTSTLATECKICNGVPPEMVQEEACVKCETDLYWDGNSCVTRSHCPCFVNHIRYEIGKVYETEKCNECLCKLNGVAECKKRICNNICEPGLQRILTPNCGCICKPCPVGMTHCSTSNVCINETFWCNGIEDCPDDERNCAELTTQPSVVSRMCPPVTCPPGTKPVKVSLLTKTKTVIGAINSVTKKGLKGGRKPFNSKIKSAAPSSECEPVECVPILPPSTKRPESCSKPSCSSSYILVRVPSKFPEPCPRYKCVRRHAMCNITHNAVDTFDGIEFKHDICNHILARDSDEMKWEISMMKNCSASGKCYRYLSITQGRYTINLYPDMSVDLDGVLYAAGETKHLGGKYKPYAVYHVGDSLLFQSNHYGFWVVWDTNSNAKLGVTGKLYEGVEGLCGTFNGSPEDDRTTPEGHIAKSNIEFGKSWAIPGSDSCEVMLCPIEQQKQAQEICNAVRTSSLNQCDAVVDLNRFVTRCMESTCACLTAANAGSEKDEQSCRCSALLSLVAECQSADASIDLSGWRTQHGCSAQCPPSFVYHDCYRHKCEPSCGGSHDFELCDSLSGTCFSGCFCPDGLLRFNDHCISPDKCRDCVCDGFGYPQYMTFDRSNFTFNGNCTYIASQDYRKHGNHTYQVLVTNNRCPDEPASTCTEAVEVRYLNHSIHIQRSKNLGEQLQIIASINGKLITQFPYKDLSWLHLALVENSEITVLVLPIQLEVTYIFHNYAFTIRLPSNIFGNQIEGLCGNCNRNKTDDFRTSKDTITNNTDDFGISWLNPLPDEDKCQVTTRDIGCKLLPADKDPCLSLINSPSFQKCRNLLDPAPYVAACQYDLCHSLNRTDAACRDMEAYVSDCERAGVCLDWRSADLCPFKCPTDRQYRACQTGCTGTCDTVHQSISNCSSVIPDGCYCPENQVLQGGECIDKRKCHPCDSEGHFDGDTWEQDLCTNCTCVGSTKECKQNVCPKVDVICGEGMIPIEEKVGENECCPKVTCVPGPTSEEKVCPPPRIPKCQDDQNVTSLLDAEGCQTLVCKCKPCEGNVPSRVDEGFLEDQVFEELEDGLRLELDNSSCCPKMKKVCHPKDCPSPLKCSYPYISTKKQITEKKCCSEYHCVPPPHSCLVEDKGTGEIIIRKVGSVWRETPCRTCECREITRSLLYESTCNNIVCPLSDISPNVTANYVIDSKPPTGECCSIIKRTACKINDTVLQPGNSLVEYQPDHCTTFFCEITDNGNVLKKYETERCKTECGEGWEYSKSDDEPEKCCGECKPKGCVVDGVFHQQSSSWKSANNCTEYFCLLKNNTVQIEAVSSSCPELSKEMREDFLIVEEKQIDKCCDAQKFIGCKYNGDIYEAGETWVSRENPCKTFSCERLPNGQLTKREATETCSTCSDGWGYEPPADPSRICCGNCKQVACIHNGTTFAPNSTWKSLDQCTNYSCEVSLSGEFQVTSMTEQCPSLSDCSPNNIYQDKCCKRCKIPPPLSSVKECGVQNIPVVRGKVIKEAHGNHGLCVNGPIQGFTECEGVCFSYTKYNQELDQHLDFCNCCQAQHSTSLKIPMMCDDGYNYHKIIEVPLSCKCNECKDKSPGGKKIKSNTKG